MSRPCPSPLSRGRRHNSWHPRGQEVQVLGRRTLLACLELVLRRGSARGTLLGVARCPGPDRFEVVALKPHLPVFPLPIPSCRKEEALLVAQAISQVTITTKHLKCQHLWWVAFRHNWRQSGNTTRAPCKRKEREARREENQEGWELRREWEEDQDKQGSRCCRSGHVHHPWGPGFLPVWRADGS